MTIKQGLGAGVAYALANPLLSIILGLVLIFGATSVYNSVHLALFEHQQAKLDAERDKKLDQIAAEKEQATQMAGSADAEMAQGDSADAKATEAGKTTEKTKNNAKKYDQKAQSAGQQSISNSSIPSNDDLCQRAVALGVRCDLGAK